MPKKYPPLTPNDVIQILEARGFEYQRTKGSHAHYLGIVRNKKRLVTVDTSMDNFDSKMMTFLIRQSGLTWEEFYCSTKAMAKKINKKSQLLGSGGNMTSEKLRECLIYFVLKHSRKIQRTKLVKLVYLSDLLSYQRRGETITGVSYISYDHGPWSQSFYEGFEETPEITERIGVNSLGDICYTYCGTVPKYDYKYLTTADIQLLQEIDEKWGNRSLKDILAYTYDTKPFKASKFGEDIDFAHQS